MADIRHSIQIGAVAESVYPLVASANGFTEWWAEDVAENGGAVNLGFFNRRTLYRLRLTPQPSPSCVDWICETGTEWKGTHIVFRLEQQGDTTLLRFTHAGWQAETDYFVNCNTTWGELMYRLKSAAEGKSRGPLFRTAELAY